jgi:hypothetical protein
MLLKPSQIYNLYDGSKAKGAFSRCKVSMTQKEKLKIREMKNGVLRRFDHVYLKPCKIIIYKIIAGLAISLLPSSYMSL